VERAFDIYSRLLNECSTPARPRCERQLRRGELKPIRQGSDPGERLLVAGLRGSEQILRLVAKLLQVRPRKEGGHDVAFRAARGSRARPKEEANTYVRTQ
jgi:hypothetical protein